MWTSVYANFKKSVRRSGESQGGKQMWQDSLTGLQIYGTTSLKGWGVDADLIPEISGVYKNIGKVTAHKYRVLVNKNIPVGVWVKNSAIHVNWNWMTR